MTVVVPTPEQRAVLEHPAAPLRVHAGAGTGKTTTIVLRLATLVEAGLAPERALGITFTNKAAEELAGRLRERLPGLIVEGRQVQVDTYHGFAHGLLREFGVFVGVERDAVVIGPGDERQLLASVVEGLRFEYLDLTHPHGVVSAAGGLARRLAENLRAPQELLAVCGGDDEVSNRRRELAAVVAAFEEEKRRLGVLTYADLMVLAFRLVDRHPDVARRIRDRYDVVLLDEYQDTDPAQRELLRRIFADGFPVVAVGDPDQTIYEWRGASTRNFLDFPRHFPHPDGRPATTLPLTVNRRSDRAILRVADRVRAELHPEGFAPLRPRETAGDGVVEAAWLRTADDEARWIAQRVVELHHEGVGWGHMAVLVRRNRSMTMVREALEAADVPVEVVSLGGLLDVPEVAELHAWLRVLGRPDDTVALARLLLGARFRLGLADLAPLYRWVRRQGGGQDDTGPTLLEAVYRLEEVDGLTLEARRRLEEFRALHRELLATAQGGGLADLCRRILDRLGIWAEVDALHPSSALGVRLDLHRFLDLARSWSPLEGRPSLEAFLDHLDVLEEDGAPEDLDTATVSGEDAVALLTVHRAKGLEWDVVFLPSLVENVFPGKLDRFDDPDARPDLLPWDLLIDPAEAARFAAATGDERKELLRQRHLAQELRAAYVAVTRARRRLCASGAFWNGGGRPGTPSLLWRLVAEEAASVLRVDEPGEPSDAGSPSPQAVADPLFPDGWAEELRRVAEGRPWHRGRPRDLVAATEAELEAVVAELRALPAATAEVPVPAGSLSVTALVTLARCPSRFRWEVVEPLPRRPRPATRHGVEFHRRIELHHRGLPSDPAKPEPYDAVDPVTPAGEATAGDAFGAFLSSRFARAEPRYVEVPIELVVGGRTVRGRIDAVYDHGDVLEVVDFKSGRPDPADDARWVQLGAYAVAVADGALGTAPRHLRLTFAHFGGGRVVEESLDADASWLRDAEARLDELVAAADGGYPPRPGPWCRTCDFTRFCDVADVP